MTGWLWAAKSERPELDTTLSKYLHDSIKASATRFEYGSSVLVVAPSGAGKTFGALQDAATEWVDVITAGCEAGIGRQLFGLLRQKAFSTDGDASFQKNRHLLLKAGENEDSVGDATLRSRWAVYLIRVLFCALATLRGQCETPRDWLFVQCFHVRATQAAYATAITHVTEKGVTFESLCGRALEGPAAVVLDEATAAMARPGDPVLEPLVGCLGGGDGEVPATGAELGLGRRHRL